MPLQSVMAVSADKAAEAPLPGTVKVTVTPPRGLPEASVTSATRGAGKAVATTVLSGVPPAAVMPVAGPGGVRSSLLTNTSLPPPKVVWKAPEVMGKSEAYV